MEDVDALKDFSGFLGCVVGGVSSLLLGNCVAFVADPLALMEDFSISDPELLSLSSPSCCSWSNGGKAIARRCFLLTMLGYVASGVTFNCFAGPSDIMVASPSLSGE